MKLLLKEFSVLKQRPLIYGAILAFGFILLHIILESLPGEYFFIFSFVLYSVLLIELSVSSNFYHTQYTKRTLDRYNFEYHNLVQFSHHLFLPSLLYFGCIIFLYYHNTVIAYLLITSLVFSLFTILFENIYSFYKHKFSLHKATNYIYDTITLILSYIWVSNILSIEEAHSTPKLLLFILLLLIISTLVILTLLRHAFIKELIIIAAGFILISHAIIYYLVHQNISADIISGVVFVGFSFFVAYITHTIDRTRSNSIFIEYIVVLLLCISLLYLYGL